MPPEAQVAEREFSRPRARLEDHSHEWRRHPGRGPRDFAKSSRSHRRVQRVPLRDRFEASANRWEEETAFESVLPLILCHPDYMRVIAMGTKALPLILSRMKDRPAPWFSALEAITGQNPAQGEETLAGATEAWLQWGRTAGLVR
jgi:hypothetical protein